MQIGGGGGGEKTAGTDGEIARLLLYYDGGSERYRKGEGMDNGEPRARVEARVRESVSARGCNREVGAETR